MSEKILFTILSFLAKRIQEDGLIHVLEKRGF
jgi:hypothetical protein